MLLRVTVYKIIKGVVFLKHGVLLGIHVICISSCSLLPLKLAPNINQPIVIMISLLVFYLIIINYFFLKPVPIQINWHFGWVILIGSSTGCSRNMLT